MLILEVYRAIESCCLQVIRCVHVLLVELYNNYSGTMELELRMENLDSGNVRTLTRGPQLCRTSCLTTNMHVRFRGKGRSATR